MIDVFHEETVRPTDSVRAGKKFKRMQLLSRMFLLSAIIFTFFLFLTMYGDVTDISITGYFLTVMLPVIVFTVMMYVAYFFTRSKKHKYLVDYDYTFVSGELRIAKVLNGLKRRPVAKIESSSISALGKTSSPKYLRYKTMPNIKIVIATPNEETDIENIYFMVCIINGLKSILIFQPSPNLLYNIKRFASKTADYV